MGLVIAFVGFNIENRADISFGFYVFNQIPIFISLFVAFLAGVVVMLPFTLGLRRRKKEKQKAAKAKLLGRNKLPEDAVGVEFSGKRSRKKGKDKLKNELPPAAVDAEKEIES